MFGCEIITHVTSIPNTVGICNKFNIFSYTLFPAHATYYILFKNWQKYYAVYANKFC